MYNNNSYATVNPTNSVNIPYGYCLFPSNAKNRNLPTSETYGNGTDYAECVPKLIKPMSVIGPENTRIVNNLDQYFLTQKSAFANVAPTPQYTENVYSDTTLQDPRPTEGVYDNYYIKLAADTLHVVPDILTRVFFSDENINHLRTSVVQRVKEITADSGIAGNNEGVNIQTPNMNDFFYYMVNIYKNYKIYNGSICFVNVKGGTNVKSEIAKLNTNVLQEYVSKMVSHINMYIYYYIDASQLPEQLSQPMYTSMKGSRSLEYNNAFTPGNSTGIAAFNQTGNIL